MRTRLARKANRAFTLIEILIVVVILGILAAIVIPQFAESSESAQMNAAHSTLQTVRSQFELCKFHNDCDCDPDSIGALLDALVNGGYLQSNPGVELAGGFTLALEDINETSDCQRVVIDGQDW